MSTTSTTDNTAVVHNVSSLLNAPKCAFKVPTALPPTLHLNEQQHHNAHMLNMRCNNNDKKKMNFTLISNNECNDDSLLSTSSESGDEEHNTPISILSILERLI